VQPFVGDLACRPAVAFGSPILALNSEDHLPYPPSDRNQRGAHGDEAEDRNSDDPIMLAVDHFFAFSLNLRDLATRIFNR
jgi:hypothetical protein